MFVLVDGFGYQPQGVCATTVSGGIFARNVGQERDFDQKLDGLPDIAIMDSAARIAIKADYDRRALYQCLTGEM